ncbi:MAG: winged helix-turn-helix domain-containing protein [Acidobacteriota bacterium]
MSTRTYAFGSFELDAEGRRLRLGGVDVELQEIPLRLLLALVSRPGETLSRRDLISTVWPDREFLDFDNNLNVGIRKVRRALAKGACGEDLIQTVVGEGYRFKAPVATKSSTVSTKSGPVPELRIDHASAPDLVDELTERFLDAILEPSPGLSSLLRAAQSLEAAGRYTGAARVAGCALGLPDGGDAGRQGSTVRVQLRLTQAKALIELQEEPHALECAKLARMAIQPPDVAGSSALEARTRSVYGLALALGGEEKGLWEIELALLSLADSEASAGDVALTLYEKAMGESFLGGTPGRALESSRRAVEHLSQAFGDDHCATAKARLLECAELIWLERLHEAAEGIETVLRSYPGRLGGQRSDLFVLALQNLAAALALQGDYARGEEILLGLLQLDRAEDRQGSAREVRARSSLAFVIWKQGRLSEAIAHQRQVLASRLELVGAEHPDVAQSRHNLACMLLEARCFSEAEAEARAALSSRLERFGLSSLRVSYSEVALARILLGRHQRVEARQLLRRALRTQTSHLPAASERLATTERLLRQACQDRGPGETG